MQRVYTVKLKYLAAQSVPRTGDLLASYYIIVIPDWRLWPHLKATISSGTQHNTGWPATVYDVLKVTAEGLQTEQRTGR